jgi:hypothetical protein
VHTANIHERVLKKVTFSKIPITFLFLQTAKPSLSPSAFEEARVFAGAAINKYNSVCAACVAWILAFTSLK